MNPHLLPLVMGRKLTLASKVRAILAKYGTDAHMYIPGVGVINGFTAGNYLDSAGTTAATVDNPVGLVLDGAGSVGSELVTNGTFDTNTTGWASYPTTYTSSAIATGGKFVVSTNSANGYGSQNQAITLNVGATYKVTCTLRAVSGSSISSYFYFGTQNNGFGVTHTAVNNTTTESTFSGYFVATQAQYYVVIGNHTTSTNAVTEFDNISVKEVTGIHASQATTADKMILRSTSSRYWWDAVDATDKLTATYPAGYESVITIDAAPTGQVTLTAQNIVGTYTISTDTYGRFVFKTLTAGELATMQTFANSLAGI